MKWFLTILTGLLVLSTSCKNEREDYPANLDGHWVSDDNPADCVDISGEKGVVRITGDDGIVYSYEGWFYYSEARGYAVIPNNDESSRLSITEIIVDDTDTKNIGLLVTGLDKDLQDFFTAYMTRTGTSE